MRTIIISDIHGCFYTLQALLQKVQYKTESDRIIFVGDYIDRGPHVRETCEFLMDLDRKAGNNAVFLMGNHEQMMLDIVDSYWNSLFAGDWPRRSYAVNLWHSNGGDRTEEQLLTMPEADFRRLLRWMQKTLIYSYNDPEGWFSITHAGFLFGPDTDDTETMVWNRDFGYGGPLVICGHTPVYMPVWFRDGEAKMEYDYEREYRPLPAFGTIDIDTACVFKGNLTAMVIDEIGFSFYSQENLDINRRGDRITM